MVDFPVPGLPTRMSSLQGVVLAIAALTQDRTSFTFFGAMQRSDDLEGAYFSTHSDEEEEGVDASALAF
jgi:hypothetical protein